MTVPGKELLFLALGGSDEIGMNVNLYGCEGKWVMVDLGLTFAGGEYPGVDLVLPDLEFIEERKKDLLGIVLTHGHEDHIGAVPYLAAELGVPLYATPFTATLIKRKLEEEGISADIDLRIIPMEGSFEMKPFKFQFVTLAHSIPEMSAVVIDTPYGRIFHTGDWKLDEEPVLGKPATAEQLTKFGDDKILALVCDSTKAFKATDSGSEGSVHADLLKQVKAAKGRVMVTSFASNAARLQTLANVAREAGRKLCVAGRSLDRIIGAAQANGYLKNLPELVDMYSVDAFKRNEVMIIATGGQGEARAALARVAEGSHPVKLIEGDTVIFSSKQIPGNEVAIGKVMNQLARRNIRTVTEKQGHVHVSGHPGKPELAQMYKWIRPQMLIPVHGERRHMAEQARFGLSEGIPQSLVQSNGDVVRLAPNGPEIVGHERTGRLVIDGDVILPADGNTINERRRIGLHGVISVAVALEGNGRLFGTPEVRLQGIPVEDEREDFIDEACDAAAKAASSGAGDDVKLRESIRLAVRRVATQWTGKKPIVDVLLIRKG
ncbi:MAG: ribonuclease J [Chakrabartia sp.]